MSLIQIITEDFFDNCCTTCLEIQFLNFRNEVKEQWNRYNNDGKKSKVQITFRLYDHLPWWEPVVTFGGKDLCITHFFTEVNRSMENNVNQALTPKLAIAPGSIDGFLKKN